jgi:hypothetical protein
MRFFLGNPQKKSYLEYSSRFLLPIAVFEILVEINIPTKFGFNWSNGFREEDCNVKVCRRQWRMMTEDDDGSKVMTVTIL